MEGIITYISPERLSAEEKLRASILFQDMVHTKPN